MGHVDQTYQKLEQATVELLTRFGSLVQQLETERPGIVCGSPEIDNRVGEFYEMHSNLDSTAKGLPGLLSTLKILVDSGVDDRPSVDWLPEDDQRCLQEWINLVKPAVEQAQHECKLHEDAISVLLSAVRGLSKAAETTVEPSAKVQLERIDESQEAEMSDSESPDTNIEQSDCFHMQDDLLDTQQPGSMHAEESVLDLVSPNIEQWNDALEDNDPHVQTCEDSTNTGMTDRDQEVARSDPVSPESITLSDVYPSSGRCEATDDDRQDSFRVQVMDNLADSERQIVTSSNDLPDMPKAVVAESSKIPDSKHADASELEDGSVLVVSVSNEFHMGDSTHLDMDASVHDRQEPILQESTSVIQSGQLGITCDNWALVNGKQDIQQASDESVDSRHLCSSKAKDDSEFPNKLGTSRTDAGSTDMECPVPMSDGDDMKLGIVRLRDHIDSGESDITTETEPPKILSPKITQANWHGSAESELDTACECHAMEIETSVAAGASRSIADTAQDRLADRTKTFSFSPAVAAPVSGRSGRSARSDRTDPDASHGESKVFVADNQSLKASSPGLPYRKSPDLHDLDSHRAFVPWGSMVYGVIVCDGDWLKVQDRFLPRKIDGVAVLRPYFQNGL